MNDFATKKLDALLLDVDSSQTQRTFFVSFFVLFVVIFCGFLYLEYVNYHDQREALLSSEQERANFAKTLLINDLKVLSTDLKILSEDPDFNRLLNTNGQHDTFLGNVERHFLSFVKIRALYDQIRFIDNSGQEVIRINYNGGSPKIVSQTALQNKADRYYFQESIQLEGDSIYLSPLDLNIEGGRLEKPNKPVIRAAITVRDSQERLKGILIVNYLATNMLERFKNWMHPTEHISPQLLNGEGYWLSHPDKKYEWGFTYDGGKSFKDLYPEAWPDISMQRFGSISHDSGIFMFTKVSPSEALLNPLQTSDLKTVNDNNWHIVSHISFDSFFEKILKNNVFEYIALGFVIAIAGVAAREHAQWRIKKSQRESLTNLLFHGIEKSPTAVFITSAKGEIEYINEAFERLAGYKIQEVIGRNPRFLKSGYHDEEVYTDLWRVITSGKVWEGRLKNKRKDGSFFWVDEKIAPLFNEKDKVTHFVCIQGDVSELLAQRDQLEERTFQLASEHTKANEANKAKSKFLANMSHEIRTPMNAIIGLTHLLKRSRMNDEQLVRLEKIDNAAAYLLTIINDILDLSKIESGKLTLEKTIFSLDELLSQIESLLQVQLVGKNVRFIIKRNDSPNWLIGDAIRLRQAILNYTVNAIKFTEKGSVILNISIEEYHDDEYLLRFEVEDTGIGIEKNKLEELFQAFRQADESTTRKFGGTGLGLAINQNLARLMGGSVGARSVYGEGSSFWFTARFNRATEPRERAANEQDVSETCLYDAFKGLKVLLVDDNEINLEVGAELLEIAGFVVDKALNGRIAVEKARSCSYSLILMDLQMPEMDGIEATTIIRSLPEYEGIPILAMTANVYKEDQVPCIEAGMNDVISKPVNPSTLYRIIGKWLGLQEQSNPISEVISEPSSDSCAPSNRMQIDRYSLESVFGSNKAGQFKILTKFIPQMNDIYENIRESAAEGDYEQVGLLAHKLKSSSRMMGAHVISDTCFALEMAGKNGESTQVNKLINSLERDVGLMEKEILAVLQEEKDK